MKSSILLLFGLVALAFAPSLRATTFGRNPNGQATRANSQSYARATEDEQDQYITGQSAQTATVNNILPLTAGSAATDATGFQSATVQVVSTGTGGTFIFEGSNDNTNFQTIPVYSQLVATGTPVVAAVTATASQLIYSFPVNVRYIRLRIASAITGGSIQAFTTLKRGAFSPAFVQAANATAANFNVTATLGAGSAVAAKFGIDQTTPGTTNAVTDTKLPASAASADATANPTITQVGADEMRFNGTTWDRARNNWNTTTGDTGAKTTTFNGATVTNYDARGAYIYVNVGTVSGTSPTMAVQLQGSFDGGTTWVNIGPAAANLTASSTTDLFIVYPANISQAAGVTPANLTSGATNTVAINAPLPRSWRLSYTIGGTTPSFTITNVQVGYVN